MPRACCALCTLCAYADKDDRRDDEDDEDEDDEGDGDEDAADDRDRDHDGDHDHDHGTTRSRFFCSMHGLRVLCACGEDESKQQGRGVRRGARRWGGGVMPAGAFRICKKRMVWSCCI